MPQDIFPWCIFTLVSIEVAAQLGFLVLFDLMSVGYGADFKSLCYSEAR